MHPSRYDAAVNLRAAPVHQSDDANSCGFQVRHFITQRQRNLFGDGFTADIFTRERPAENGHRASQHPFHRFISHRLRILRPLHGNRCRATNVTNNNRWLHAAGTVALYPTVLRKDKPVEVLAKVFHHVITLGLAMYQHIQSQTFLFNNGLPDMFRNARAVVIGVEIALLKSRRRVRISVVCGRNQSWWSATLAV